MYYRTYTCLTERILVYRSTCLYFGSYPCITEHIHVFRILYVYYRPYTCISDLIHVLQNLYLSYGTYTDLTELILVFRSTYWYFGSYTCITELIHVFQILYMSYKAYTCLTDLILVLQNLLLSYGSYSCAKVPVGTRSRNRSGSYHIQGQIRLLQIRTFVFRRYRSQIHYTEVLVGTTGLILILQNLCLFFRYENTRGYYRDYSDTGVPVGTTEQIQRYIQIFTLILYSVSYHMSI